MIWIALAILVVGYFIYQAIQQNTKTKALTSYKAITNRPSYIKKETEGKRLYVKRVFEIAKRDLKTRDLITDQGVKLFPVDPRKNPKSLKLPTNKQIKQFQENYKKVMDEKQQIYVSAIKDLDSDSFFLEYDFMAKGENPYVEEFFDLKGNEDLRKKYDELNKYAWEITAKYDEVQDKIQYLQSLRARSIVAPTTIK